MVDIFCFSRFEADRDRHELRKGSRRVKLERIPLELLFFLLERHRELVTREEIVQRIWGTDLLLDTERSINTAVRKIRRVLGDNPQKPKYLETIVGKGYRFVGALTRAEQAMAGAVKESAPQDTHHKDGNEILLRRFAVEMDGKGPILTGEVVVGDMPLAAGQTRLAPEREPATAGGRSLAVEGPRPGLDPDGQSGPGIACVCHLCRA